MAARDKSRFTTAQAGWIALAIFGGWLVFLFLPVSRKPKPAAPAALPPVAAQSKLEAVGLANNPDWQGLPDYFAIWADKLSWKDDRTRFAYWNPGSQSYSYYFEAERSAGTYRFRSLTRRELDETQGEYVDPNDDRGFTFEMPEQVGESPAHPFVFFANLGVAYSGSRGIIAKRGRDEKTSLPAPTVKVDLPVEKITPPPPPPAKSESH